MNLLVIVAMLSLLQFLSWKGDGWPDSCSERWAVMLPVTVEWHCQGLLRRLSGHLLCPLWEHINTYHIFVVTENSFPFLGIAFLWPHFYLFFTSVCLLAQDCPASTHWSSGAYEENSVTHRKPFWGKKGGNPFPSARYVLGLNLCPLRYVHKVRRHRGIWGFPKGGFFVILLAVNEGWDSRNQSQVWSF